MSSEKEFSWGPDKRARPAAAMAPGLLVLCVVALLAAGAIAVAVHHAGKSTTTSPSTARSSTTTTTTAPPGAATTTTGKPISPNSERLLDLTDHLSLAIPPGWQAPNPSSDGLAKSLKAMKAADPSLATVVDIALATMSQVQLGVFAIDPTSKTELYAYGAPVPGTSSADSISITAMAKQVEALGGKNVHVSQIRLPVGPAGQATAEFTINGATVAQAVDYFVVGGRLVTLTVVSQGNKAPLGVLRQIEPTLAIG